MSIWQRLFKFSPSRQAVAMIEQGRAVGTPRNYEQFSEEAYRKNHVAYSSIGKIAQSCAGLDWVLYQKRGRNKQEIENHPLLDLIQKPNPMQTGADFIESVVAFRMIAGNSFMEACGPNGPEDMKPPLELWPVRPDRMKIVPGIYGLPQSYEFKGPGGLIRTYPSDPITGQSAIRHWKSFNPLNDWYGMSPIEAAMLAVDQHNESSVWNLSLLTNSGKPSGALVMTVSDRNPTGKMSAEQKESVREQLQNRYGGSRNAGRIMLLEGGLDWKALSMSPTDMDWLQGKHTSARDIALTFGVPPQLLGIPGDNTYANYKEARMAFYEETVLPIADALAKQLNNWLAIRYGDNLILDYDKDRIEALEPKRESVWMKLQTASFLTINEKREAVGYEALPEEAANQVMIPPGLMPLSFALDEPMEEEPEEDEPAVEEDPDESEEESEEDPEGEADDAEDDDEEEPKNIGKFRHKAFNLSNRKQRNQYKRLAARIRMGFEKTTSRQLLGLFRAQAKAVADAAQGLTGQAMESAIKETIAQETSKMGAFLIPKLMSVGKIYADQTLAQFKSYPTIQKKFDDEEDEEILDIFEQAFSRIVRSHVGEKIQNLEQTTREKILSDIKRGMAEAIERGDGIVDIQKTIRSSYAGFSKNRSIVIARTEHTFAANQATIETAKATGVTGMVKEWVSTNDERTRGNEAGHTTNHLDMDGVQVGADEQFEVWSHDGIDLMDAPGDQSAPADQVVNCRCNVVMVPGGTR